MILLYIDPGTGSMLFTILIGLIGTAFYFLRNFIIKLKFWITRDKSVTLEANKLPIVIFSDHKRYWSVFKPVCDEFEKRSQRVVYMTQSEDDPALSAKYEYIEARFIGEGNKGFSVMNMLNASIVLSTTPSLDVFQWKRSKDVDYYIHMLHAAGDVTMYRMFGIDHYDSILLSGEYQGRQVRELERLRGYDQKDVCFVGIPYMDVMLERYRHMEKKKSGSGITVLLAPSWGANGILSKYGEKMIDALIKTGYEIIIRPHPQSFSSEKKMLSALMEKYDSLEWNREVDNFDVLNRADIMISDFSGVIFDYSLIFDKPVIYTSPEFDGSVYDCCWLDGDIWTFTALPRIGMELSSENLDDIGSIIDKCVDSIELAEGRSQVRKETWMYPGEGAKRVVDYTMEKLEKLNHVC